jgi:hypothetical protein
MSILFLKLTSAIMLSDLSLKTSPTVSNGYLVVAIKCPDNLPST